MAGLDEPSKPGELRHTLHSPMGLVRFLGVFIVALALFAVFTAFASAKSTDRVPVIVIAGFFLASGVATLLLSTKFRPTVRIYENGVEYSFLTRRFVSFSQVESAYTARLDVQTPGLGLAGALAGAAVSGDRHYFWSREGGRLKSLQLDKSYEKPEIREAVQKAFEAAAARAISTIKSGGRYESPLGPWVSARELGCREEGLLAGKDAVLPLSSVEAVSNNVVKAGDGKKKYLLPGIEVDWVMARVLQSLGVRVEKSANARR